MTEFTEIHFVWNNLEIYLVCLICDWYSITEATCISSLATKHSSFVAMGGTTFLCVDDQ